MSTSRVGFRFYSQAARSAAVRAAFRTRQAVGRRFQTTDATAAPQQSLLKRLWESEVGVKTVHFWAPVMKWTLVLAGVSDMFKPAEKLSLNTNAALTATGSIWTRWCFVIKPRNLLLAAVNASLAVVGVIQCTRIFLYEQSKTGSAKGAVKEIEAEAKETADKFQQDIEKVTK